jgi:hypothetical protein
MEDGSVLCFRYYLYVAKESDARDFQLLALT